MASDTNFEVNDSGTFQTLQGVLDENERLKKENAALIANDGIRAIEISRLRKQLDLKTPEGLKGIHE